MTRRAALIAGGVGCMVLAVAVPDRGLSLLFWLAGWYCLGSAWVWGEG